MEFILAVLGILWFILKICLPLFILGLILDQKNHPLTKKRFIHNLKVFFGTIIIGIIGLICLSSIKKWWRD
jgi:hypothetical protein